MAAQGRYSRAFSGPRRKRASPSPPCVEAEGEWRWPGPARRGRSWGGGRGAPRRPHRAREGPEKSSWSPESGSSWRDSNLEGKGRSWLPPGGEEDWGGPVRSPREAKREGRRGSLEPPQQRGRSPPTGEGWRGSLSPPKGRAWTSPMTQRQPRSRPSAQGNHSGMSRKGDPPWDPHSPPVPRDRRGVPERESSGRSPTRPRDPSTSWAAESPLPPIRRVVEGRPRGLEEPGGGHRSNSHRTQGDPEWETRQGYSEEWRESGGGRRERWRGSRFQNLPRREGDLDLGSDSSRGRKRDLDPTGPSRDHQEWKEDSEGSGSFSPQTWFSPKKRRKSSDDREPIGTEEESWARDGGCERRLHPMEDQDDWESSSEVLEDWIPKEGREGKEGGQRGLSRRPAKRPAPAVGWVPREEVVSYWKRCQSLLPKMMKRHFLSTCPRPTIPDGSTRIPQLNQSLLKSLSSRQLLKISSATRHSFASHFELMDMLAPSMTLYEMAESAIENREAVDPLDVQELARRLISYVGSLNQSLTMQRCSQVLGTVAPQLRWMTIQIADQNAGGLLFAEEKVKIVEDVILASMEEGKEVNLKSFRSSDQETEAQDSTSLELWHRRFAHAESKAILQLHKHNFGMTIKVNPGDIESIDRCAICLAGQGKKPSFPLRTVTSSARLLDLIHCELCGPFSVPSRGKHRYALIFVDDFSRYCVTYQLRQLGEAHKYFRRYLAMLRRMRGGGNPKAFQFNSAGESSWHMKRFLEHQRIPYQSGVEEEPGQSRTAAREVALLLEMTRCMLADAGLPNSFWDPALMNATYLLNRLTIAGRKKTPFQVWQGHMPSIGHIRIFGSLVYERDAPHCSAPYIFIGYNLFQKGYRVMDLETGQFSTKCSIRVEERKSEDRKLSFEGHRAEPLLATMEPKIKESSGDTDDESSTPGGRSEELEADEPKEPSRPPSAPEPVIGDSEPLPRNAPATWEDIEAMPADEGKKWRGAAREEIEGLRKNSTWTLTKLPPGKQAVGCKWVFKVEPGAGGQAERYTARLVLKKPGGDVDATVKLSTTRMLLGVSASKQMQVKHLEVKTASLRGGAAEEMYMEQPPGFVNQKRPDWACKLKKGRCSLQEASRAWKEKLGKLLVQRGFKQDEADQSLHMRSRHGHLMFILACASHLVVASQHEEDYGEIVASLKEVVEVKELGDATGYLGILAAKAVDSSSLLN